MPGMLRGFKGLVYPSSFTTQSSMSVEIGHPTMVAYSLLPSNTTNPKITWSSADTSIATIDSNGVVTGIAVGNTTITGVTEVNGLTQTISLSVTVIYVTGVTLNASSIEVNAGESFQLTATVTPSDASNKNITWSSSNTSVAVVDGNGLVNYVGDGNATITCTTVDGGHTATCAVSCVSFVPVDTCFGYTGAEQSISLKPHTYCLEVWGASGFCNPSYSSGRGGGYSSGCITLTNSTCLYIYVGGHPSGKTGGWNGGGSGYNSYGTGGGGGTDIRMGGNTLYHRFIVAGGSGGNNCAYSYNSCYYTAQGGAGGGACGMEGYCNCYIATGYNRSGGGGSQTSGGVAWSTSGSAGSFGQGGTPCSGYNAGGGGGGWYGGGGAYDSDSDNDGRGGGGGSGYTWTSSTRSSHPTPACLCGVPYLTGAKCCPGCVSFPSPSGSTETGHFGHGCVRIRSID